MKPYYQDGACTIYCGDAREVLPAIEVCDLLLTDPKYGINADRDRNSQKDGWRDYATTGWDKERTTPEELRLALGGARHSIVWGGNYFTDVLTPSMGWLVWDKGQREFSLADCELAWTSFWVATRAFDYPRAKALQDGKQHPTQKPLELMRWCMMFADHRGGHMVSILDPFMGSGTTLRAAKDLGRKAIGIEIEERYCEIAAQRLAQEVLQLKEATA